MSKARILGLSFGVLMIIGAFALVYWQASSSPVTGTALAQGATATPTAGATSPAATPAPQQQQQQQQAAIGDSFWALLAAKLGVNIEELKTQAVETRKEMIDQAVTDGRATQEQADAIKERIDANSLIAPIQLGRGGPRQENKAPNSQQNPQRGPFGWFGNGGPGRGFGGLFGGMMGRGGLGQNVDLLNAVADALNLEPSALVEQMSQGQTLAEIATAQGVDEATVKQAIITYYTAKIDEQLALGLISEVQANQLKSQLTPDSIDLSRGLHFNFRVAPGQGSSQLLPGMDSESFEFGRMNGIFGFGEGFAVPGAPDLNALLDQLETY